MSDRERILLGHGGGGRLSRDLIEGEILSRFGDGPLAGLPDGARLDVGGSIVFSTDSFVVQPTFFPGGNIGDLAVHGTVNDIAVCGGRPRWLSLGMIVEEGLPLADLRRVLDSVKAAAKDCGVVVATGDTKVVAAGQCDGIYLNTAGIGNAVPSFDLGTHRIMRGDVVIASGPLGDHGMAVMAARSGMNVGSELVSDTGPVHRLTAAIEDIASEVRFMRDPTRGGAAAVLNEMVEGSDRGVLLKEAALPFSRGARAVAEVMGIDLLHVASEGRMIAVVEASQAQTVLDRWRILPEGKDAAAIGFITAETGRVVLETAIGGRRMVDVPQGEILPRIC